MAHSKSALKRWRQNEARRARNKPVRTAARTAVKRATTVIESAPSEEAQAAIREASSILGRAAKRRVIHPNAASRHKSRMMKRLNKVAAATVAETPAKGRKTKTSTRTRTAATKTKAAARPKAPAKAKAPAKPRATKPKAAKE